jgi:hypothetical protein
MTTNHMWAEQLHKGITRDNMSDNKRPWNETPDKPFSVTLWWDKPGETDTCMTGVDFSTEKEARLALADLPATFSAFKPRELDVPYILLDGPGVHEVTCRTEALKRSERERKEDERMARSENAMQQGMGLGIHAHNEAMGYDSEPYDPDIHDNETPWGESHSAF